MATCNLTLWKLYLLYPLLIRAWNWQCFCIQNYYETPFQYNCTYLWSPHSSNIFILKSFIFDPQTRDRMCHMTVHVLLSLFLSEVVVCAVLSPPENGFFIQNMCNNQYNSACGVRCLPGFELQGSSIRLCQADGTWSGAPPTCTGEAEDSNIYLLD